ncbi:hypothetical protein OPQ81_008402 [Rhizoctonia solani]|nr:hypothetical protein OPQ81_008402 [Rhizoctonia solani]
MSGNKRKRSSHSSFYRHNTRYTSPSPSELPLHARPLRIPAYEAELVQNRTDLSDRLETRSEGGNRGGLIRWGDHDIWVDRFDVRLLLESLEDFATPDPIQLNAVNDPPAEVGWDDLPSDAEDTFFLTPKEVDEYHHDKRRRMLERERQERLRALAEEDEVNGQGTESPEALWGGSDEEPDDAQANLMRRTAAHIRTSPNPKQLEMRILANHGADPRFAFLRGRWKRAWVRMQQEKEQPPNAEAKRSIMGGLSAYASDSDSSQKSGDQESPGRPVAHAYVLFWIIFPCAIRVPGQLPVATRSSILVAQLGKIQTPVHTLTAPMSVQPKVRANKRAATAA